jgi:hypothetical protein
LDLVALDLNSERFSGTQDMLLTGEVFQPFRTHAFG